MSHRVIRPFLAVALLAGVAAGAVIALVVPAGSHGTSTPPITVLPPRHDKPEPGMVVLTPVKGSARIELQKPDPKGGPPFAIRMFRAIRRAPAPVHGRRRPGRLLGHDLCAQLGRVYQGRFGWLDAQHRFRPVRFRWTDAPILCGYRWRDARSGPQLSRITLITDPLQATAEPVESVVWGFGGTLLRSLELTGRTVADTRPKLSPRGAFISFTDPNSSPTVSAHFTYRGRPPHKLALDPARPAPVPPPLNRYRHGLEPGTERLEARAPDPTGGLAWGVQASRTTKGGYCTWDEGRVVGSRVGRVNYQLGTIDDPHVLPCLERVQFTRRNPISFRMTGGSVTSDVESGADPDRGRVALRTLPGRTVMSGLVRPDVREFTIDTGRDVRTIVPSPRAHAFIVVYDGGFPVGDTIFRVTYNDGTHSVQRMLGMPF